MSRNICKKQWSRPLGPLRERITKATSDLPLSVKSKVEGSTIHYWDVKEVIGLLEEEAKKDPDSGRLKNLFGRYNSDVLYEWDAIRKEYEKDNLFLAEAARLITQDVVYEVPAMKKLIQSSDKQASDVLRKISDSRKSSQNYRNEYNSQCERLGVKGVNLRKEVQQSTNQLKPLLREVENATLSPVFTDAIKFYEAFSAFTLKLAFGEDVVVEPKIVTLKEVRSSAEARPADDPTDEEVVEEGKDADDADGTDGIDIDWGISVDDAGASSEPIEIDWGMAIEEVGAGEQTQENEGDDGLVEVVAGGIDWGIETGDGDDFVQVTASDFDLETDSEPVAAFSTLEDPSTRRAFLSDLLELDAFLAHRLGEVSAEEGSSVLSSTLKEAPAIVLDQSIDRLTSYVDEVRRVLELFKGQNLQQLLMIKTSQK